MPYQPALAAATLILIAWSVWAADARSRDVVLQTLGLGLGTAAAGVPLGLAVWRAGQGSWFRNWAVRGATVVAATLPAWVHVCGWDAAFGRLGWLTGWVTGGYRSLVPPWLAAVWVHAALAAPQIALLLHWFQAGSGWDLEETASLERPARAVFWQVTLPRVAPALVAGGIWALLTAGREIAVTDIYQVGTLAELVYLGYSSGANDSLSGLWPGGRIAMGLPLYALVLGWLLVVAGTGVRMVAGRRGLEGARRRSGWEGLRRRPWLCLFAALLVLGVPAVNLLVRAGLRTVAVDGVVRRTWSLSGLWQAMQGSVLESGPEWQWSLLIAGTGATLVGLAALAVAVAAGRNRVAGCCLWGSVALLGALPGPVIGRFLVWIADAGRSGAWVWLWDRTIAGPVLASGLFLWPLAAMAMAAIVENTPRGLMEQAALDGMGPAGRFLHIIVGTNARSLGGVWLLLFALFLGELSASHLVRPSGIDILPRLALGKMHSGIDETMAAIGLWMGLVAGGLGVAGWYLLAGRRGGMPRTG